MKIARALVALPLVAAAAFAALTFTAATWAQDGDQAEMMRKWKEIASPGPRHKLLDAMIGEWETTTTMGAMPATKGTARYEWILGGRFVEGRSLGSFGGMTLESRSVWGFDNFKKHYLLTNVDTSGTHMIHADGKAERDGKAIHFYGRMDEWLDGTSKNNRYTLRLDGPDRWLFEVYDLDIGEKNNLVFTIEYRRKK